MGNTTASGDHASPDADTIDQLVMDLYRAFGRVWRLRRSDSINHPSTPAAINVALDDIADTVARLRDLL